MEIKVTTCYSKLVWLMMQKDFQQSVSKLEYDKPQFDFEGMAGYIETNLVLQVSDISKFAEIWGRAILSDTTKIYGDMIRHYNCRG